MNYKRLTNEELNKCKYPNLIAEIIESGYSTSTLADFMGLGSKKGGKYRPEGDPEVWDKINGKEELCISHIVGLSRFYGVKIDYICSNELTTENGKPAAYWRWLEYNRKQEAELKKMEEMRAIEYELHSRPELLEFMKLARTWSTEQVQLATEMLLELADSDTSVCQAIGA